MNISHQEGHLFVSKPAPYKYTPVKPTVTERPYTLRKPAPIARSSPTLVKNFNIQADSQGVRPPRPYQYFPPAGPSNLTRVRQEPTPPHPGRTHPDNQDLGAQRRATQVHSDTPERGQEATPGLNYGETVHPVRSQPPTAESVKSNDNFSKGLSRAGGLAKSALNTTKANEQETVSSGSKVIPTLGDEQTSRNNSINAISSDVSTGLEVAGTLAAFL